MGRLLSALSDWLQMISSAIKLPALYPITLTISLPKLYFFDILFGSALTFGQYTLLTLISVPVISVLLLNVAIFAFIGLSQCRRLTGRTRRG